MNVYRRMLLTFFCVLLAVTLFNDFLAASMFENQLASYILHFALLAAIIAYAVYYKHESLASNYKLAVFRHAWRQIPCGIAVFKDDKLQEICAEGDMFQIFGLVGGKPKGDASERVETGRVTRTETYLNPDGTKRYADRFIIPLKEFNGGGYVVEFLVDASERMLSHKQQEEDYINMIKILVNMFEMKDPYSRGHSEIVCNLSQELSKALGVPKPEICVICKAALLHDIGKIIIPAEILNSKEKLSAQDYEIIRAHAAAGADILAGMSIFQEESLIVRHHHERFDGKGYPSGLAGAQIPRGSRIIAVVDAFEAMTSGRSAAGKYDVATTLSILEKERERQFDPEVVNAFVGIVRTGRAADHQ